MPNKHKLEACSESVGKINMNKNQPKTKLPLPFTRYRHAGSRKRKQKNIVTRLHDERESEEQYKENGVRVHTRKDVYKSYESELCNELPV